MHEQHAYRTTAIFSLRIILVPTFVFVHEIIADGENERRWRQPKQRMRLLDDRMIIKFAEHGRQCRRQLLATAEVTEVVHQLPLNADIDTAAGQPPRSSHVDELYVSAPLT